MDYSLTFALLLYINIFYFGLYAAVEFCLIMYKGYTLPNSQFSTTTLINELIFLVFLVVLETVRLILGHKHEAKDFDKDLASVFRIMVLTFPSTYAVAYFTVWQPYVTRLEVALGGIMITIQICQFISSFLAMFLRYFPRRRKQNLA